MSVEMKYYRTTMDAPEEMRFVDGAHLTGRQVNELAEYRGQCGGDLTVAREMFRERNTLVKRGVCCKKWFPISGGN